MNYTKCIIFGAGDLYTDFVAVNSETYVIAADGGLELANKLGITPDIILGDFDSYDIEKVTADKIVYPTEKDYTDTVIACEHAYNMGIREIEIYGGIGGERFEHTVANLQTLTHFAKKGCSIFMHDKHRIITVLSADSGKCEIKFSAKYKGYISLFAISDKVADLTVDGLKYTLEKATLTPDFPVGVSNEFCGKECCISFSSGNLLIIYDNSVM